MDERVVQFRVGVMVLATLIITAILIALFGEFPELLKGKYVVYIHFHEAPGITPDTPIKKSGVLIGRVSDVELLDDGVRVTARIDADKTIRQNEAARISSSLLGDSIVHIVDSGNRSLPREPIGDGGEIPGLAYNDPIQVIANLQDKLAGAIGSVTQTSDELGNLVHQVGGILKSNEDKINRIVTQADETSALLKQTMTNANDIFGDAQTKANIRETIDQVPELMRDTRETIQRLGNTVALVDKNLENLDRFTGALGDQGNGVVAQIGASTQKLDALLNEMLTFSQSLNSGKGSLGRLMNDEQLYDNISQTAANMEDLSRKLRPIVNDMRVFSDKLARDPGSIGVRGALQRNTGTKW